MKQTLNMTQMFASYKNPPPAWDVGGGVPPRTGGAVYPGVGEHQRATNAAKNRYTSSADVIGGSGCYYGYLIARRIYSIIGNAMAGLWSREKTSL
jgi:hypothetical protein